MAVNAGYWYFRGDLQPENIDSSLFTHLFAAFADVRTNTSTGTHDLIFPEGYETQFQNFAENVKKNNPDGDIKAILSIGGDTDPSIFATIASQLTSRETFIANSIEVAKTWGYDGLSLNWQYPNTSDEMDNLGDLLTEWRAAVDKEAPELLLTAAVYYSSEYKPSVNYPIQAITDSLDWINVMAYDLKTPASDSSPDVVVPPAPLHNPASSPQIVSVEAVVNHWITAEVPANKLVLGLPFHGRSWVLQDAEEHEILAAANGASLDDPILYRQIQDFIKGSEGGQEVIDHSFVTQYGYAGTTWIGYDGKDIIFDKVIYAKQNALLGYFAWHVDGDDYDYWTLSTLGNYFITIIIYISLWISCLPCIKLIKKANFYP
jgi:chitinase